LEEVNIVGCAKNTRLSINQADMTKRMSFAVFLYTAKGKTRYMGHEEHIHWHWVRSEIFTSREEAKAYGKKMTDGRRITKWFVGEYPESSEGDLPEGFKNG